VGTHKAPSIKVAEASKIIENAQRDVNISFVNELALIFDKYVPQVILSGRHVNNSIAPFIANKVLKLMIQKIYSIKGSNVLGLNVDIYDPWASKEEVKREYGIDILNKFDPSKKYEAILLAVAHTEFESINFEEYYKAGTVVFDAKAVIDRRWVDGRL